MTRDEKSRALEAERQGDYGDPLPCHAAIAQAWNALLTSRHQPKTVTAFIGIDAELVALMMTAAKLVRLAHRAKKDSFDDAHVYLDFAERFADTTPLAPAYPAPKIDVLDIPETPRKDRVTAKECLTGPSEDELYRGF